MGPVDDPRNAVVPDWTTRLGAKRFGIGKDAMANGPRFLEAVRELFPRAPGAADQWTMTMGQGA